VFPPDGSSLAIASCKTVAIISVADANDIIRYATARSRNPRRHGYCAKLQIPVRDTASSAVSRRPIVGCVTGWPRVRSRVFQFMFAYYLARTIGSADTVLRVFAKLSSSRAHHLVRNSEPLNILSAFADLCPCVDLKPCPIRSGTQ
jgi:hypothetical protein